MKIDNIINLIVIQKDSYHKSDIKKLSKSIFIADKDNSGSVSAKEQIDFALELLKNDKTFKEAMQRGFDTSLSFSILEQILQELDLKQENQEFFNIGIKTIHNGLISLMEDYLKTLNYPPKRGNEGWGYEDTHFNYLEHKFQEKGIKDTDDDVLIKILATFNDELDKNFDSFITLKELKKMPNKDKYEPYMNRNKQGDVIKTHVLDWVVNKYCAEAKHIDMDSIIDSAKKEADKMMKQNL